MQSAAVQAGEKIMQYGQSIADGEVSFGQIPRLLGEYRFNLLMEIFSTFSGYSITLSRMLLNH